MEMQLRHDGVTSFCCYHYDIPFAGLSFDDIWNSPFYRRTREDIVKGDAKGTRCDICPFIKYNNKPKFLEIPDFIQGDRRANWEQALTHFRKGDVILESVPVKYYLSFGLACNLRCKMCDHPTRFNAGEKDFLDPTFLFSQSRYLALASEIYVIGGEPFLIPNAVKFMEQLAARDYLHDMSITTHTNGFFLQRYLHTLEPLKHLTMAVSVDSYGERYEYIRKRAHWDRLDENLSAFLQHGRERNRDWRVQIVCTVMKSGLLGYPELMEWVIARNMDVHFGAVASHTQDARDENVFANPELLRQTPGWDQAMEKAIAILRAGNRIKAADQLSLFHQDLRQRFEQWDAIASRRFTPVQGANAWTPLYSAQLPEMPHHLQFNIYNGARETSLAQEADALMFKPSDKRDHLATSFTGLAQDMHEGERFVRLVLEWPEGYGDKDRLTYEVQDQRCVNLEPIGASDASAKKEKVVFYRLADVSQQVRLIMFSPDQTPRVVPRAVSLETLSTLAPTGYSAA
jgi:organic radical activating enzyme